MEAATDSVAYFQILPTQHLGVDSWPFKFPSSSPASDLNNSPNLRRVPETTAGLLRVGTKAMQISKQGSPRPTLTNVFRGTKDKEKVTNGNRLFSNCI